MNFSIERKKSGSIIWSVDQERYIVSEYSKGISATEIGRRFKVSGETIRTFLRKRGIKTRGYREQAIVSHPRKSNIFSNIDTKEKAYWLGFLYADGCVSSKNNTVSITSKDENIVLGFKKFIGASNTRISSSIDKRFSGDPKSLYHFSIKDAVMKRDLIRMGVVPNKSLVLGAPKLLRKDLVHHFIRGYLDGDGSIHLTHNQTRIRISFVGTKSVLNWIKDNLSIVNSLEDRGSHFCLQSASESKILEILSLLYLDSEGIRLERKYNIYKNFFKL